MAYVDKGGQADRKTAIVGVAAIHAVIGTVLVTGLAGGVFAPTVTLPFEGEHIEVELTPPPPPDDVVKAEDVKQQSDTTIFLPDPIVPLSPGDPPFETTPVLPPSGTEIIKLIVPPADPGLGTAPPPPPLAFDPVSASPRNNISDWVTTDDYRTSWINREMVGIVRFKVSVGTNGRVQDCQILASTGHTALDTATCKLVKRRAKFNPARNGNGDKVTGSFTRSVKWQLPD